VRSTSETTNSAFGRPIFAMPPVDHKRGSFC
jgi:hypothetical protein